MPLPQERPIFSQVLIVADHPTQLATIHDVVLAEGFQPIPCQSTTEVFQQLEQLDIGIAVVSLSFSGKKEVLFFDQLRLAHDQMRIIIYTEQGALATAYPVIAEGAFPYLEKAQDPKDLALHLLRAKNALRNHYFTLMDHTIQNVKNDQDPLKRRENRTTQFFERNTQRPLKPFSHQKDHEGEESFGRIFDQSLFECYIVCATTFRFLHANRGALKNVGYTLDELLRMSPPDISSEWNRDTLQHLLSPLHNQKAEIVHCETIHHRKDGSRYPVELHIQLSNVDSMPVYIVVGHDMTERKHEEEALANLVAGTASVAADQFFPQLVRHLASALDVNFAAVTELCGPDTVSTFAVWHGNSPGSYIEYVLPDTPCEQVFQNGYAIYPSNVQARFPKDTDLKLLQAECYLGVSLTNEKGEPLGHLFILDTKPYVKTERAISILKIFGARASAELLRQKTEKEKAQRESLLTLMLNTGPGCINRVASDGTLLSMNPAGLALIDACHEEEALGLSVFDLVVPEHRLAFKQMHQTVIEGTAQTLQFEIEGLNGTRRWMETYAAPFQNPITNQVEHLAVTHDITDRKKAADASQRSEQAYRALYDNNPTMYFTVSQEGIVQSVNQFGLNELGYTKSELIGTPVVDIFHKEDQPEVQAHFNRCLNQPAQLHHWEFRKVKKNGQVIWVKETARVIQDAQGKSLVLIVCEDITIQKQAELALKKSEEKFRRLFEDAPMGICLVGPGGVIHQTNPAMSTLTGYDEHEMVGQTYARYTHPEDIHKNFELTSQLFQGKRTRYEFKKRYICKSGEIKWVIVFVSSIHTDGLADPSAVAIVEDITEQKRYEETLTEMNLALAHAMPGISQLDAAGCYRYVNKNYANFLGRTPSELLGQSWESMVHPDDLPLAFQAYEDTIKTGKGEFEARAIRQDGSMFYKQVLLVKADPVKNPGVSHHCFMRDISDRKKVERTLQVSEQSIRELYEMTSTQDSPFDHKIRSLLKLGCQRFGLPVGALTHRIKDHLKLEFLHSPDSTFNENALLPIRHSFCGIALERSEPLWFKDIGQTEWKNSSAFQGMGLEAYIGTKVIVGNQVYGSLCFLDQRPHQGNFSSADIHFLQLMARWIGGELERKQAAGALQEANERLRALSQQLLTVQENERRQLARDLHDEIGQTLTAVKINLQTLGQGKSVSQTQGILRDSMEILDSMLKHVRELSLDLRPSLLDDLGLVAAVRWFVNRQAERAGWTATIDIAEALPPLHSDHATACFRVIQEALTNVMRHAQASQVTVELRMKGNHLDLLIADNGIGFDSLRILGQSVSGQTLGLLSMQERVRFLDGNLTIVSQRNQGTQVRAHIPITTLVKDTTAC